MELRICVYNLENLFIRNCAPENQRTPFKSAEKLNALKKVFEDIDADIYALSEVGGEESLEYFNTHYLNGSYHIGLIPGNSDRNIQIAFLMKKTLPFYYKQFTYKNHQIDFNFDFEEKYHADDKNYKLPRYRMSRDLSELQIFKEKEKEKPILALFNVHLKSALDPEGIDFKGKKRRGAELNFCLKNFNHTQVTNAEIPIILCGDFNGNASRENTDDEFKDLYSKSQLEDVLEVVDLPPEQRSSYFLFNGQQRTPLQLDYAFISKEFHRLITDACLYRYKNENGIPKSLPRTMYDVWNNPSDHYPLVFTLQLS